MSKPIDYDAPRRSAVELDSDGLDDLKASNTAALSPKVDVDEAEVADRYELPGADLSDEELSVTVVPMQADEFRCARCFLIQHRSQLAVGSQGLCRDCS